MVGLQKVEREAIIEKLSAKIGQEVDNYGVREDLQQIYRLKYFEFVEIHQRTKKMGKELKNVLVVVVKERPIITKVKFSGNNKISDEDLKEIVKTKEFSILDINSVQKDIRDLQKHYEEKGFFLAAVSYKINELNAENVELEFQIKEFDKVRVKKINFLGNKALTDQDLKAIMETREESLLGFMTGAGNFKEFNFQTDIERIKYFYKTKGHLQVNIGTPEVTVSEDKKWVFISIRIQEGPQFTVNNISFQGEMLFDEALLLEKISMRPGSVYSEDALRLDIQLLTEMYQDEGYAFANVLRTLELVPGENKVDVEFSFEKGKIAHFGKISIVGNTQTRDKVIRRELKIREGARFSGTLMRDSKDNVNRLGFFEPGSVVFNTVTPTGKDDVLDVEIQVKEKNTGQISLGAGYSTATGLFFQSSIAQNNFLGRGQTLSFSVSYAEKNKTYNFGFTEPYLFDTQWTAGGDIYKQEKRDSRSLSYSLDGLSVRIGHPIFEYTKLFLAYKYEDTTIRTVEDTTIDPKLENGVASSVEATIVNDKRNHRMEPSSGHYLSLSSEYAGLGGEKKWLKSELDARWFARLGGEFVFRSRLFLGQLWEVDNMPIPRTQKFSLGGPRNLRGYTIEGVGPKSTGKINGQEVIFNTRGMFATFTTLEIEHPLAREAGLKWVVFFAAGEVNRDRFDLAKISSFDLKSDYGVGLRWFSPIGILRFELGFPINPAPEDRGQQFQFDIGQLF